MTHPTQEDDVKAIRDALAPTKGDGFWINKIGVENLRQIYRSGSAACMLAALGNAIDAIDDAKAHIDAQAVRLDAAEKLAADRLDQMNADRKQALVWRDQAAKLFESLDGVVGLAVLGAAKITNYQAAIRGAQELISKYRAAIASEAKT